jgi:hypothetical protein
MIRSESRLNHTEAVADGVWLSKMAKADTLIHEGLFVHAYMPVVRGDAIVRSWLQLKLFARRGLDQVCKEG